MKIYKVSIIGLGLIGGSLAMAIKKRKLPVQAIGASGHASTVKKALKKKIIDYGAFNLKAAVHNADLVFICTPINKIIPILKKISPHLKKGAIVTDVGSTKSGIVKAAQKIIPKYNSFIGGHPMAGTEKIKLESAFPELFTRRPYILTPVKGTSRKPLKLLSDFLKKLKVNLIILTPELQDELVAGISHLPLAVASALSFTIAGSSKKSKFSALASSGFKDTTRIASGDPMLGVDLFSTNKKEVLKMFSQFKKAINNLENAIKKGNLRSMRNFLGKAKAFRDRVFSE